VPRDKRTLTVATGVLALQLVSVIAFVVWLLLHDGSQTDFAVGLPFFLPVIVFSGLAAILLFSFLSHVRENTVLSDHQRRRWSALIFAVPPAAIIYWWRYVRTA
jgi:hypothetical protein